MATTTNNNSTKNKHTFTAVIIGTAVTAGVLYLTVRLISTAWASGQK
ncbi:MAG: hypothetical protein ACRDE2_00130 [Chitinophagaceae bacterium]